MNLSIIDVVGMLPSSCEVILDIGDYKIRNNAGLLYGALDRVIPNATVNGIRPIGYDKVSLDVFDAWDIDDEDASELAFSEYSYERVRW